MYTLIYDPQFKIDYKKVKREHPEIVSDLKNIFEQLHTTGTVQGEYHPHILNNFGGNYNGHYDLHVSEGKVDIVMLYLPHKTNPTIRLVRLGPHAELFQGPTK